jgi:hypothetical protein
MEWWYLHEEWHCNTIKLQMQRQCVQATTAILSVTSTYTSVYLNMWSAVEDQLEYSVWICAVPGHFRHPLVISLIHLVTVALVPGVVVAWHPVSCKQEVFANKQARINCSMPVGSVTAKLWKQYNPPGSFHHEIPLAVRGQWPWIYMVSLH